MSKAGNLGVRRFVAVVGACVPVGGTDPCWHSGSRTGAPAEMGLSGFNLPEAGARPDHPKFCDKPNPLVSTHSVACVVAKGQVNVTGFGPGRLTFSAVGVRTFVSRQRLRRWSWAARDGSASRSRATATESDRLDHV